MKYLNVGCGGERDQSPDWVNLDDLHSQLPAGTGARKDLDREANYVNFRLLSGPMPFHDNTFEGVILSHVLEHFNAQDGLKLLLDCRRILKPGGVILISVPDAHYFRRVYTDDRNENWPWLFGVTDPNNPIPTFFEAALWFEQHSAIMSEDTVWAYLIRAGFREPKTGKEGGAMVWSERNESERPLRQKLNRLPFSLIMTAIK